jgi:hypothetical protein
MSIDKVIIDTPAMLNMIKHCQEGTDVSSNGIIMGVFNKNLD